LGDVVLCGRIDDVVVEHDVEREGEGKSRVKGMGMRDRGGFETFI
jgi:hypothetical protein